MELLKRINSPSDLKNLSNEEMNRLADELRCYMLDVISESGGHLASSLGVVELTIAMHYVFNTPEDRIIWDVGHQTYPHKILTGRREEFRNIRRYGGISGFPKRKESEYDPYDVGHSSTSISLAAGEATGRDLAGKKYKVVAVIGDGSLRRPFCAIHGCRGSGCRTFAPVPRTSERCSARSCGRGRRRRCPT